MKFLNFNRISKVVIVLLCFALVTFTSSCQNAAEKTTEKLLEKSAGEDVDVDFKKDKLVIETKDGKFTTEETTTWPKDMPNDVPKFEYGKLIHVSTQEFPEGKSWTVMYEEVPENALEKYKSDLQSDGYEIESTIKMGTKGNVTAKKGERIVIYMIGEGMATLTATTDK